jgi:hypothetical protein
VIVASGDVLREVRTADGAMQLTSAKRSEALRVNATAGAWWWDGVED